MSVFPATMDADPQRQVDEISELFSQTLHSLAADAAAIRQISSLAEVTGIQAANGAASNDINMNDPSIQQLIDVDRLVTGLEQKVQALRAMVAQENAALEKFETTLRQEADSQEVIVDQVSDLLGELGVLQERSNTAMPNSTRARSTKGSNGKSFKGRRDSVDPRATNRAPPEGEHQVSLERVSAAELKQIRRTTMGRISLLDLNEALEEIERVCDNKLKAMPQSKKVSSNTLQRRFEYLKQQRANVDLEVEAHAGHTWVSEQELRENCPFFRHGEATARATLSMLCSLKRLKQVPGRNTEITYICLPR